MTAIAMGFRRARIQAYLVELALLRRDHKKTRPFITERHQEASMHPLQSVMRFWEAAV